MKLIKLTGCLLFLAAINTSCLDKWLYHITVSHEYPLLLSFQDSSGNDLVSGIEDFFNEDDSWSRIKDKNIISIRDNIARSYTPEYSVSIWKYDGYYYVEFSAGFLDHQLKTMPSVLTFRVFSPHIFGDHGIHQIVTYWKPGTKPSKRRQNYECYRIEYEGREITEIARRQEGYGNMATIILER